jgi:hypothetical protein
VVRHDRDRPPPEQVDQLAHAFVSRRDAARGFGPPPDMELAVVRGLDEVERAAAAGFRSG